MKYRRSLMGGTVCWCALLAVMPAWAEGPDSPAASGPAVQVARTGPMVHRERPDDPWLAGTEAVGLPGDVAFGGSVIVQVNIDDLGNNIPDDAGNEPSIAVDPTAPNRMAIGWRQFDNIASNFRQAGYSFSVDGGRTWAGLNIIEAGLFRSDPVLGAGVDGTFYYLSIRVSPTFASNMFISSDHGATWPVSNFAFGGDKQWFSIDKTGGIGDGHIYQGWNVAGNEFFPNQFNRSVDGGVTWEEPVQYDPLFGDAFPVFGLTAIGPDGAAYVAGTRNDGVNADFWVVRSSNAQDPAQTPSFEQITPVDMGGTLELGAGPNPAGLLGQVNINVDHSGGPNHGNVYVLASINPQGPDPLDIHFLVSTDNGVTFSSPIRVNDDAQGSNSWQWFGQMSVAPNGRIDVIWNDTRNSPFDNISELFYSFSTDGGRNWAANVALSPSFNSFLGFPNQNKLGDYYDLVSDDVGAHLAWAATFNGEQDVYYLRIGDYDCNGNGVGDADDIANLSSADCNANGIPDECEIAAGTEPDDNGNGIIDSCEVGCPWDCADGDGTVGIVDFLELLGQWKQVGSSCDFDGNGVGIVDFLKLLGNWGVCP